MDVARGHAKTNDAIILFFTKRPAMAFPWGALTAYAVLFSFVATAGAIGGVMGASKPVAPVLGGARGVFHRDFLTAATAPTTQRDPPTQRRSWSAAFEIVARRRLPRSRGICGTRTSPRATCRSLFFPPCKRASIDAVY